MELPSTIKSDREMELEERVDRLEKLLNALQLASSSSDVSPTSTLTNVMHTTHTNDNRTVLSILHQNSRVDDGNEENRSQHQQHVTVPAADAVVSLERSDPNYMSSSQVQVRSSSYIRSKQSPPSSMLGRPPTFPIISSACNNTGGYGENSSSSAMVSSPLPHGARSVACSADDGAGTLVAAAANAASNSISSNQVRKGLQRQGSDLSQGSGITGRVMASPALKPVSTVLGYVKDEMASRHQEGKAEYDSDVAIQEFLSVPYRAEGLLMFGLLVCVDCFLYVLTFLPLKFVWSMICLMLTILNPRGKYRFERRHFYHVVQIAVIAAISYMLHQISIGRLYHWIRAQSMIKLYVIVAIVDVFDRLLVSFGKDATNSLYWNINRRPYHPRCITSILVVLVYAGFHALCLFVHAATINVAMNSADSALLSLLVSGNFAEIKSTVFKKYQKKNLFDITTSDINERFKLCLFIILIFILNVCQGTNTKMINDFAYVAFAVFCSEIAADWIKHCFITKLNLIKSSVYIEYRHTICSEITGKGANVGGINMDHTHNVVRRMGLAQIPLACVMVRFLLEATKYSSSLLEISNTNLVLLVIGLFVILFIIKIFLGIVTLKIATLVLENSAVKDKSSQTDTHFPIIPAPTRFGRSVSMRELFHGTDRKLHSE
mmetsp:Transcript_122/g.142  ORF Transcript_122/g.142 Transcript_122/m.142 type:complete len:662 (-) Transcript_122:38-2023(-)